METLTYILALVLMLIGGALILKTVLGQSNGFIAIIGFLLLIGGITTFNKANNEEPEIDNLTSSVEHQVINGDIYQSDIENETNGRNAYDDQGEGIDFSKIDAENQRIIEESNAKREAMMREQQAKYEAQRSRLEDVDVDEEE